VGLHFNDATGLFARDWEMSKQGSWQDVDVDLRPRANYRSSLRRLSAIVIVRRDRHGEVVLNQARREHRLPVLRARRPSRAVVRSARADPLPRAPRRRGSGPVTRLDVDADGNGLLQDGRLYQLVRERDAVHERTLEIAFLEPGAEAYAFTFG
jgi:Thioredoxin like C-terminal domain